MKKFENGLDVQLMIWETNPRKRNLNNEVKFVTQIESHKEGDIIIGSMLVNSDCVFSCYEITSINNVRPFKDVVGSKFRNGFYVECVTQHKWIHASKLLDSLSERTKSRALKAIEEISKELKKSA